MRFSKLVIFSSWNWCWTHHALFWPDIGRLGPYHALLWPEKCYITSLGVQSFGVWSCGVRSSFLRLVVRSLVVRRLVVRRSVNLSSKLWEKKHGQVWASLVTLNSTVPRYLPIIDINLNQLEYLFDIFLRKLNYLRLQVQSVNWFSKIDLFKNLLILCCWDSDPTDPKFVTC